jgi:peptidoglycan hydrolase-like protein with peptidoglycan-binding domain
MNKQFKNSFVAGVLALAILTTAAPVPKAEAATLEELQTQIAMLLEKITALQGQVNNQPNIAIPSISLSRNLSQGMTGSDVEALQKFLNSDTDTLVAISGAGSKGNETMYFGPATHAAVIKYQNKYRTQILTPLGLNQGTGFVGASTRSHINARGSVVTPPNTGNPSVPDVDDAPGQPISVLRGEGDLDTFEIEAPDNTSIREAASDEPIAELTLEARDGDIEISRLDLTLVADNSNSEKDPWDTFEDVSLWIGGKKIAEKKIDTRSAFQNRNTGLVRFSNLDLIIEEDEEIEVTLAVSIRNRVNGAGANSNWSVSVDSLRYKNGVNVVTVDTTTGDLKKAVSFEIVERGDGEELKFSTSNTNPSERTVIVDDQKRTNNITLLSYTIEALGNDIELDKLYVNVQTGTAQFDDVVSDFRLKIGNKVFKKHSIVTTGNYSTTSVLAVFDIDNKIKIDEDEKVTVEVIVDLKAKTNYQNGETIFAQITSLERDRTEAEGADDVESFSGSVIGKVQTLIAEGIFVPIDSVKFKTETLGNNSTVGVFTIEFEVTAVEGDFFITDKASTSSINAIGGIQYSVDTTAGVPDSVTAILSSTADEDANGVFKVRWGQTETFTLTVTVDAANAGSHRVLLEALRFSNSSNGITNGTTYTVTPVNEFRTPYQFINN